MVHVARRVIVSNSGQGHLLDVAPGALGAVGKDALYLIYKGALGLEVAHGVELVGDTGDQAVGGVAGLGGLVGECRQVAGIDGDLTDAAVVGQRLDGGLIPVGAVQHDGIFGPGLVEGQFLGIDAGRYADCRVVVVIGCCPNDHGHLVVPRQVIGWSRDGALIGDKQRTAIGAQIRGRRPSLGQVVTIVAADVVQGLAVLGQHVGHVAEVGRFQQVNHGFGAHLQGVAGHVLGGSDVGPVGTEAGQADVGFVGGQHHGGITLDQAMAGNGNHHILGTGAAQRQRGAVVLDGGGSERHSHFLAGRGIGTGDDSRVHAEHAARVVEGNRNVARQCLAEYLDGLIPTGGHHHVTTVDGIGRHGDGGRGDRAFHVPEAGCAVLIDDHVGHGFAQVACTPSDSAAGVHVELCGGRGCVGELGLAVLGPQVGGLVIVGPRVIGVHQGHQLDVLIIG